MVFIFTDEASKIIDEQLNYLYESPNVFPYSLGFLGYTSELSKYGLRQFAENNEEQVRYIDNARNEVKLNDGTTIKALNYGEISSRGLTGHHLDQLILFDDERWLIGIHKGKEINEILSYMECVSRVPEDFRIIRYEDVRS